MMNLLKLTVETKKNEVFTRELATSEELYLFLREVSNGKGVTFIECTIVYPSHPEKIVNITNIIEAVHFLNIMDSPNYSNELKYNLMNEYALVDADTYISNQQVVLIDLDDIVSKGNNWVIKE